MLQVCIHNRPDSSLKLLPTGFQAKLGSNKPDDVYKACILIPTDTLRNAVFCAILNGIRETDRLGAAGRIPSTVERYGRFFFTTLTITLRVAIVNNI